MLTYKNCQDLRVGKTLFSSIKYNGTKIKKSSILTYVNLPYLKSNSGRRTFKIIESWSEIKGTTAKIGFWTGYVGGILYWECERGNHCCKHEEEKGKGPFTPFLKCHRHRQFGKETGFYKINDYIFKAYAINKVTNLVRKYIHFSHSWSWSLQYTWCSFLGMIAHWSRQLFYIWWRSLRFDRLIVGIFIVILKESFNLYINVKKKTV